MTQNEILAKLQIDLKTYVEVVKDAVSTNQNQTNEEQWEDIAKGFAAHLEIANDRIKSLESQIQSLKKKELSAREINIYRRMYNLSEDGKMTPQTITKLNNVIQNELAEELVNKFVNRGAL